MLNLVGTKANKEQIITILHKKSNKNDVERVLAEKVSVEDFNNLVDSLNQLPSIEEIERINKLLATKADKLYVDSLNERAEEKIGDICVTI